MRPECSKVEESHTSWRWAVRKASPAEAASLVADLDIGQFRSFCVGGNVKAETLVKYEAKLRVLQTFRETMGYPELDESLVMKWFYILFALEYSASTVEDYRSAVAMYLKRTIPDAKHWFTENLGFRLMVSGLKKRLKRLHSTPRGPITEDYLIKLLPRLPKKYVIGTTLAYFGLLRHGDVLRLRVGDVRERTKGRFWLAVWGGKCRDPSEMEWVDVSEATDLLKPLIAGRDPEEVLFRMWDPSEVNKAIRVTAWELKWKKEFTWSFHSLRHGRAVDLRSKGISSEELKVKGRWRSSTHELYQAFPSPSGLDDGEGLS